MSMQAFSMASTHTRWTAIVKLAHLYMASLPSLSRHGPNGHTLPPKSGMNASSSTRIALETRYRYSQEEVNSATSEKP